MLHVQNTAGVHAGIALCGKSIGGRSANMLGCGKTSCVQCLNKLLVPQADSAAGNSACSGQKLLRFVLQEGFLLEQVGLVFM